MKTRKYLRIISLVVVCAMISSMLPITSMAHENHSEGVAIQESSEAVEQTSINLLSTQADDLEISFAESNYTCYAGSVITLSLVDNGYQFLSSSWACDDESAVVFLEDHSLDATYKQVRAIKEGTYTITAKICTFTNDYSISTTLTILPVPDTSSSGYSYQVGDEGAVSFSYSYAKPIEGVEWVLSDEDAFSFTGETSILSTVTPDTEDGIYEYVVSIPIVCLKEGSFQIGATVDMGDQQISVNIPVVVTQQLYSGELEYIGDLLTDTTDHATIDGVDYEINENCTIGEVNQAYYGNRCSTVVYSLDDDGAISEIYPADLIFEPAISISSDTDSFTYKNESWNSSEMNVTVALSWKLLSTSPFTKESISKSSISINIHELLLNTESDALNFGTTGGIFSKEIKETYESGIQLTYGQTKKLTFVISVSDDYVPTEITDYAEIQASVTSEWSDEAVECRPLVVSLGNLDLQAEKAAEAKKVHTETQTKKAVSSQLDLMKEKSVISYNSSLASRFTDEEYEKMEEFLLLYLGFLLAMEEDTFLDSFSETCKAKVQAKIESLLGVDNVYSDYLLGLGTNSKKATVKYRTTDKEGNWTTVTFNFAVDLYTKSGGVSYGSLAKINYSIEGDNQSSSIANFLYVTYVDFDAFSDLVLDYVNLAANEIYSELLGTRVDIGENIDKLASELVPEIFDKILGGSYSDRIYNAYIGWLKNSTKKYSFHCPVDVYVYDRNGNLVASVVNNEIDTACTDILAAVNGDSKIIYLTGDSYRMELIGSDEGSMAYTIEEFENGALSRTVQINDIPLESGIVYDALAPEYPGIPAEAYSLSSDAGDTIYADEDSLGISTGSNISLIKSGSCGEDATYRLFSNGMLVISGTGAMDDYSSDTWYSTTNPPYSNSAIKYVVVDQGITRVGDFAFSGDGSYNEVYWNDNILEIVIADSVTEIGEYAFYRASNLQNVYIGSSVANIGDWSFSYCYGLNGIHVDDANENYVSDNGVLFSKDMTQLVCYPRVSGDSYTIPDGVTTLGADAFGSNYYLKSIVISESVTSIGESAFDDCAALETVTIEGSFVPDGVFTNCPKLSTLIISENLSEWITIDIETLTKIQVSEQNPDFASDDQGAVYDKGYSTLLMCPRGFSGDFVIPESVTAISGNAFDGCSGLTSITIPDGVETIGSYAFRNCSGLTEINIPEGVANIGSYALYGCTNLSYIEIPGSVSNLGRYAFDSCAKLLTAGQIGSGSNIEFGWTESLPNYAFHGCDSLTTVELPSSITSIGDYAFYYCSGLTEIDVPDGVVNIGEYAFYSCSRLSGVEIPEGVTEIKDDTFGSCSSFVEVVLPNGITSIGSSAFSHCDNLTTINLPDQLTTIGSCAFYSCSNLNAIEIPACVTSIGSSVFYNCKSLTAIDVVTENMDFCSIDGVLYDKACTSVIECPAGKSGEVIIPDGVTTVAYGAFRYCSNVTRIEMPDTVTSIENYGFAHCSGLSEMTLSGSLQSLSTGAFEYCSGLNQIMIPASVTYIDSYVFGYCTGLSEVIFVGNCPSHISTSSLYGVTANVYYNENNSTWTSNTMLNYGGTLTWTAKDLCAEGYHNFEHVVTAPTCIDGGYTTHTCICCNESIVDSYQESTGIHTYGEWYAVENSEETSAVSRRDCVYCDHYETEEFTVAAQGTCGDNLTWVLPEDGMLRIQGYGDMDNWDTWTDVPWYNYREAILSVQFDDSVTSIGDNAFRDCCNMTDAVLSESTVSIGAYAFADCSGLIGITIPKSVIAIGEHAFVDCSSLSAIVVDPENDHFSAVEGVLYDKYCTTLIRYPMGKTGNCVIPDGVVTICENAFRDCSGLESIKVPDSVSNIGDYAFYGCSGMTQISLPGNVQTIGSSAFRSSGLLSICFVGDLPSIAYNSFSYVEATCYYPADNSTWDSDALQNYGGSLTWVGISAQCLAGNHSFTNYISDDNATCSQDGTKTAVCDNNCGSSDTIVDTGSVREHSFLRYEYNSETNTSTALCEYGCGTTDTIEGFAAPVLVVGQEQTAHIVEAGEYAYFSYTPTYTESHTFYSVADNDTYGYLYDSSMNQLAYNDDGGTGTNFSITYTLEAGKTYFFGARYYSSSNIGTFTVVLEANHTGIAVETIQASCTENGMITYVCDICGTEYTEIILAGHDWDEGTVTKEETCTEDGIRTFSCTVCDEEYTESIAASGHDWNQDGICNICAEAFYESGMCGENITWELDNWGTLTISGEGEMTNYSTENDNAPWYRYADSVKNVIITSGVTSIGDSAFYNYSSLSAVTIGSDVANIGDGAFCGCVSLESIVIPTGVTNIASGAFRDCDGLANIDIANSVTSIGEYAFYNCDGLNNITIPSSVCSIGEAAFSECNSLLTINVSQENSTYISVDGVLYTRDMTELVSVPCGKSGTYNVAEGTEVISGHALSGCNKLTNVVISDEVITISNHAFYNCDGLTTITIPDSVTEIGSYAFYGGANITSVSFGSGISNIGSYAFAYCPLTFIEFFGNAPSISETAFRSVEAVVQYPYNNTTWTSDILQDYGGTLTWVSGNPIKIELSCTEEKIYIVGDAINKNAISVVAVYENGTEVTVPIENCIVAEPDMTTSGKKLITVIYDDLSASFEIGVHEGTRQVMNSSEYPESDHNYANGCNQMWNVAIPGAAMIELVFAEETYTEDGYDYIYVYDGSNTEIASFTGDQAAGTSVCIPGDVAVIQLVTDGSVNSYGFAFEAISSLNITHSGNSENYQEPTCTAEGWTGDYICDICGLEITGQSIPAVDHSYENGKCTVCGEADPDYSTTTTVASGWSGDLTWVLTDDGVLSFSGSGAMKNYTYKSEMPWYSYMDQITSVVIESGATRIGSYAFYGMTELESVKIPETVTTIGDYAFKNATTIDDVVLPSALSSLGDSAFYGCTSLTSIDIPASLYTVKPYTFKNCTALAEVTFHEGNLMKLSDGAFYGTALTEVEFPACLDIIDVYCFKNCSDLASITIPEGDLTQIREAVFYGTAIPSITIPEGVTKVGPYAFKNCVNLETVSLPATLTSVGEASFYACTALMSMDIPDAVTTIGNYAFRRCTAMTSVTFGSELTDIGESSFYGCTGLATLEIPDKVTTIQGYAFKGCTGVTAVSLGSSVTTIGESAFHTCTAIKTIEIPASVETIGDYCFSGSYNLWQITFEGAAPSIGSSAFKGLAATAYYPADDSSWTSDVMQNYGGAITWKVVDESGDVAATSETVAESEEAIPEETEEVTEPEETVEEETVPEETVAEEIIPETTEAEETQGQETVSDETVPAVTESTETAPGETVTDEVSDETVAEESE